MQFSWKSVGRVILLWLGLMVLVFIDAFFGREEITFFLIYGYALVTSFLVTKLVEKKSIP